VLTSPESQSKNSLKDIFVQADGWSVSVSDEKHQNCSLLDRCEKITYHLPIEQSQLFDHHLLKNSSITIRMVSAVLVV
jgi:hypothetical protein